MKNIKKILQDDLADNEVGYKEYLTLVDFAKPYEGKKITRAIANKLPAGYTLKDGHNSLEIVAPSGNKHYFQRFDEMNNFSLKRFHDTNAPYSKGAPERIEQLKVLLNDPDKVKRLEELMDEIKTAYLHLKHLAKKLNESDEFGSYPNPAFYDILREYGVPSGLLSDLHFDKYSKGGKIGTGLNRKIEITW